MLKQNHQQKADIKYGYSTQDESSHAFEYCSFGRSRYFAPIKDSSARLLVCELGGGGDEIIRNPLIPSQCIPNTSRLGKIFRKRRSFQQMWVVLLSNRVNRPSLEEKY